MLSVCVLVNYWAMEISSFDLRLCIVGLGCAFVLSLKAASVMWVPPREPDDDDVSDDPDDFDAFVRFKRSQLIQSKQGHGSGQGPQAHGFGDSADRIVTPSSGVASQSPTPDSRVRSIREVRRLSVMAGRGFCSFFSPFGELTTRQDNYWPAAAVHRAIW